MKRLIFALAFMLVSYTSAHAEDWVHIAGVPGVDWHIKPGSLETGKRRDDAPIAVMAGKITDKVKDTVTPRKWYVLVDDCRRRMGTLYTCKINGDYEYENEFLEGDGRVATSIAILICDVLELQFESYQKKQKEEKEKSF